MNKGLIYILAVLIAGTSLIGHQAMSEGVNLSPKDAAILERATEFKSLTQEMLSLQSQKPTELQQSRLRSVGMARMAVGKVLINELQHSHNFLSVSLNFLNTQSRYILFQSAGGMQVIDRHISFYQTISILNFRIKVIQNALGGEVQTTVSNSHKTIQI